MPKRKLTPAEKAAYRELSQAAAKLRRAQKAAEEKQAANVKSDEQFKQDAAEDRQGVDDAN